MIVQTIIQDNGRASIEIPFQHETNPFTMRLTTAAALELGDLLVRAAYRAQIMEAFNMLLQQSGETGYQSRKFIHDLYQQVNAAYAAGEEVALDDGEITRG